MKSPEVIAAAVEMVEPGSSSRPSSVSDRRLPPRRRSPSDITRAKSKAIASTTADSPAVERYA
ncbi:hypothetical protein Pmar_PMAR022988 [Perkinsus marinus ATCC 50983]|uniref:Uncharacterized protein n=1 Tax=Perkinsus marinus (strain ATCC 50983 / TXsc) TaxID=423536 RepID=C5LHT7_PERM5|nr:hypothetical protein Pmar_PMAR022988 [Perkinsus marinus ATCC 50983]EER03691.1 hypothetical protein Pmar_PMAR022988 [Perkinsus marinus ATCC 50983]|eukprot:XP_002771875.1 hypothetical protein Pmar_PMAR022988 [Perkinsus marinus ATCC 50983]